jgi:hypothetical protein
LSENKRKGEPGFGKSIFQLVSPVKSISVFQLLSCFGQQCFKAITLFITSKEKNRVTHLTGFNFQPIFQQHLSSDELGKAALALEEP